MEEDIKILKRMGDKYRLLCRKYFGKLEPLKIEEAEIKSKAIENILNRLEQLEKENKKLTEARNWYFEHTVNKAVTPEMLHKILRQDYIPKSEIREKKEELEKKIEIAQGEELLIFDSKLDILKELLGGK